MPESKEKRKRTPEEKIERAERKLAKKLKKVAIPKLEQLPVVCNENNRAAEETFSRKEMKKKLTKELNTASCVEKEEQNVVQSKKSRTSEEKLTRKRAQKKLEKVQEQERMNHVQHEKNNKRNDNDVRNVYNAPTASSNTSSKSHNTSSSIPRKGIAIQLPEAKKPELLPALYNYVPGLNKVTYKTLVTDNKLEDSATKIFTTDIEESYRLSTMTQHCPTTTKGMFAKREKEAVDEAVKAYLQINRIPLENLKYLVHKRSPDSPYSSKEFKDFYPQVLIRSRLNRTKVQLQQYMRRSTDEMKLGPWKPEEDNELMNMVTVHGQKWELIKTLMCRSGCRERYRILLRLSAGFPEGVPWTAEEDYLLAKACKSFEAQIKKDEDKVSFKKNEEHAGEQTEDKPNTFVTLKAKDDELDSWQAVSNVVKTRNWRQCLMRWYDHLKPIVNADSKQVKWTRSELFAFLNILKEYKPIDETDIQWPEISARSYAESWSKYGRSANMLRTYWFRIRQRIQSRKKKTLREAIQFCIDNYENILSNTAPDVDDSDIELTDESDKSDDDNELELIF